MTTLDQVHLLEEKVESAVEKLQQLQAENDALRNKCAELTNALSSKTEQLSSFTTDQNEIEDGIKKALDRLNYIENSVLKSGSATINPNGQASIQITPGVSKINNAKLSVAITPSNSNEKKPVQADVKENNQVNNINNLDNNVHTLGTGVAGTEKVSSLNFHSLETAPNTESGKVQTSAVHTTLSAQVQTTQNVPTQEQPSQSQDDFNIAEPEFDDSDNSDDFVEGSQDALGFDIF